MFLSSQYMDEFSEDVVEPILCFCTADFRHGWLWTNDFFQQWNDIGDDFTFSTDSFLYGEAEGIEHGLTFGQQDIDHLLKCFEDGEVWDGALELIKLTFDKIAVTFGDGFVYFAHQRGFACTRVPGYEHEFFASFGATLVSGHQVVDLLFAAI